jgi:hypothetical protein
MTWITPSRPNKSVVLAPEVCPNKSVVLGVLRSMQTYPLPSFLIPLARLLKEKRRTNQSPHFLPPSGRSLVQQQRWGGGEGNTASRRRRQSGPEQPDWKRSKLARGWIA